MNTKSTLFLFISLPGYVTLIPTNMQHDIWNWSPNLSDTT